MSERSEILKQLEHHLAEAARLRGELDSQLHGDWRPSGFYTMYHIMAGIVLGGIGAGASLLWNVVGATLFKSGEHPLYLIQVYLTFGLGGEALNMDPSTSQNQAWLLFLGCLLYLGTGALYGILLQLLLRGIMSNSSNVAKFVAASVFGLALWAINFYAIISWLQPMLFDGRWILELVPWYVGASTHLVFAWAFLLFASWGRFDFAREHAPWAAVAGESKSRPAQPPGGPGSGTASASV